MERHTTSINGRKYEIDVVRRTQCSPKAVSIVQPCHNGRALTEVSIECIRKFTRVPYQLWVVDNVSTDDTVAYLLDQPDINLILNHTAPWKPRRVWKRAKPWWKQQGGGSYANGVALELAAHLIQTRYMFVMHNDALPCKKGWMDELLSLLTGNVAGVGVRQDPTRVHAMHGSGFLFDFSLFRPLQMSFLPDLPNRDVGDLVTERLREAGYQCLYFSNTFNNPDLLATPAIAETWLRNLHADKAVNDDGQVIYMHLGRGTLQISGSGNVVRKTSVEEWLHEVRLHLLLG